jgi:NADH-quinone oxidoreductase subunit M
MVQKDMKRMAAFSTLSHLSFITLGIFTFTIAGMDGGIYQILNHGISGGALFMMMGLLYERYHTYEIRDLGGLAQKLPWLTTMFVIATLSIIGLPMLNGFVGEFLIFTGSMQSGLPHSAGWTVLGATGVIFGAAYMLSLVQKVFHCELGPEPERLRGWDLDGREHLAMWPMVALFLAMGVASPVWMKAIDSFTTHGPVVTDALVLSAKSAGGQQ